MLPKDGIKIVFSCTTKNKSYKGESKKYIVGRTENKTSFHCKITKTFKSQVFPAQKSAKKKTFHSIFLALRKQNFFLRII